MTIFTKFLTIQSPVGDWEKKWCQAPLHCLSSIALFPAMFQPPYTHSLIHRVSAIHSGDRYAGAIGKWRQLPLRYN
jgi:hypothetical protein